MPAPTVVILAAGEGTRMRSALPKVLHPICGRPLVLWPLLAARGGGRGERRRRRQPQAAAREQLPDDVEVAIQERARGTGDAVAAAGTQIDSGAPVVIMTGDMPLITGEAIGGARRRRTTRRARRRRWPRWSSTTRAGTAASSAAADGTVERVVETKAAGDATEQELAIREVNTGLYAFDGGALLDGARQLDRDNAQGELYLPDVLPLLAGPARPSRLTRSPTRRSHSASTTGSTSRASTRLAQRRIHERPPRAGVTIVDPASTLIDADVTIGPDTTIEPSTFLRGATRDRRAAAASARSPRSSTPTSATASPSATPTSTARPPRTASRRPVRLPAARRGAARERQGGHVRGDQELHVGAGSKVPHLSYIGDADIGEGSNLGAGTITANYDGRRKHRTTIGDRVGSRVDTSSSRPSRSATTPTRPPAR